jgi:hypothetical protein
MYRHLIAILMLVSGPVFAQVVEVSDDKPQAPKEKAADYFKTRQEDKAAAPAKAARDGAPPRYLALHIGTFFSDQSYAWGRENQSNVGNLDAGIDYRMGEWVNSMDWSMRINYTSYGLDDGNARKLSMGAILTFPDVNSRFPLYFGAGLGAGFFIKQVEDEDDNAESPMALDYSILLGARFFDVIGNTGFLVETGLKNHLLLSSDGQFNGVYVNVGAVFAF